MLSCAALDNLFITSTVKVQRHAEWMDKHCPGTAEVTVPACHVVSSIMLDAKADADAMERELKRRCGGSDLD